MKNVKVYMVGGAVRDLLLGKEPNDYDFVVVGSTPEEMLSMGYKCVGKDFPVFLHPNTKEEFALARTERKIGTGHKGFLCEWQGVTLLEDMSRRDLTINAMAIPVHNSILTDGKWIMAGDVIDYFEGQKDLASKTLRHVSQAFEEDPLRVLRLARFSSQLGEDWTVDFNTLGLCRTMFWDGKLNELTKERVWKETEKALGSGNFFRYIEMLDLVGYLKVLFPFLIYAKCLREKPEHHPEESLYEHIKLVVEMAERGNALPEEVLAALLHDSGKPECYYERGVAHGHDDIGADINEAWCRKWKVPNNYRELAVLVAKYHTKVHGVLGKGKNKASKAKSIMNLFQDTGAEKNQERFEHLVNVCSDDAKGRGAPLWNQPYPQREYLLKCLDAVLEVDTKSISTKLLQDGKSGIIIGEQIRVAKIDAIRGVQREWM